MEPTPARPDPYYGPVAAGCAGATLVSIVLAIGLWGLGWTREVRPGEWNWVPPALTVVVFVTPVVAIGGLVCGVVAFWRRERHRWLGIPGVLVGGWIVAGLVRFAVVRLM